MFCNREESTSFRKFNKSDKDRCWDNGLSFDNIVEISAYSVATWYHQRTGFACPGSRLSCDHRKFEKTGFFDMRLASDLIKAARKYLINGDTFVQLFHSREGQLGLILLCIAPVAFLYGDELLVTCAAGLDPQCLKWWKRLSQFSSPLLISICSPTICFCTFRPSKVKRKGLLWLIITISTGTTLAVAHPLKVIVGRARPHFLLDLGIEKWNWWTLSNDFHSFPSGHTITLFVLATSLSLLYPRFRGFYFLGGLFISMNRLLLLQHHLSDILGTAGITIIFTWYIGTFCLSSIKKMEGGRVCFLFGPCSEKFLHGDTLNRSEWSKLH